MSNLNPQQTYNQYKIRRLTWNEKGESFGITIPRAIAEEFMDMKMTVSISGTSIILTSGIDLVLLKKEVGKYDLQTYQKDIVA